MTASQPIQKILLLTDGSEASEEAARYLVPVAKGLEAAVTLFAVVRPSAVRGELEEALAKTARLFSPTGLPVETAIASGHLVEAVVGKAAQGYGLTALATQAKGREQLSLKLWRIAKGVATPVLLVPPGAKPGVSTLLLCSGGERYIERGVRFVADLSRRLSARAVLLHVLPPAPEFYKRWDEEEDAERFLAGPGRLSRQLRSQAALFAREGAPCRFLLRRGEVADAILGAAAEEGADLIAVGSSPSHGLLRTHILGDVTRDVVVRSTVPVLILRSAPRGLLRDLWEILREPIPPEEPAAR